jgi:hypothetical protein
MTLRGRVPWKLSLLPSHNQNRLIQPNVKEIVFSAFGRIGFMRMMNLRDMNIYATLGLRWFLRQ